MNTHNTPHVIGMRAEQLACDFIVGKGYRVIERNYRIKGGEIDIIAKYGTILVFLEVKMRKSSRYGYPEESIGKAKLLRLCKAIKDYIAHKKYYNTTYRFDIISIINGDTRHRPNIVHIDNVELPLQIS